MQKTKLYIYLVYNALDVAQLVIEYYYKNKKKITNLPLQRILYYIQMYYLKHYDRICFRDKIEAWQYGAVVPSVYNECRAFGVRDCRADYYKYGLLPEFKIGDSNNIGVNDKPRLEGILEDLIVFDSWEIQDMLRIKGSAWDRVEKYYEEIPIEWIREDTTMELPRRTK